MYLQALITFVASFSIMDRETSMHVRKQQLGLDIEQQTGSK